MQDEPELADNLSWIWSAFWELGSDRPIGMGGAGPIPFSSLDRYAGRYDIDDGEEFDRFRGFIRRMDAAYLKWARKKGEKG